MLWGVGVLMLLAGIAWLLKGPGSAPLGRAFGVLIFYCLLFWLTLLKVWWTAGKPAVEIDEVGLHYRPLHRFGLRTIQFQAILFCGPRPGTQSLRLIHEARNNRAREFFLNLAVIDGRHQLLDVLGARLESVGLERLPGRVTSWKRPGWSTT